MTTNVYDATCDICKGHVVEGEGLVSGGKIADGSWRVVHNSCIVDGTPAPVEPVIQRLLVRRIRLLVEELETLEPGEIEYLRATPQAALLREWLGTVSRGDPGESRVGPMPAHVRAKLDYDL